MNATITRKTYYALGLVAAACSMAATIGALSGVALSPVESLAFALTGMMFLLLAAIKGSSPTDKRRYFLCFLLTLAANVQITPDPMVNFLLAALPWPVFAVYEQARGNRISQQLRLLVFAEAMAAVFRVCVAGGFWPDGATLCCVMEILAAAARGWLAMVLYRLEADRQAKEG